jgi:hypothetical protein
VGGAIGKCDVILEIEDSSAGSGKDRDEETRLPSLWSCRVYIFALCPQFVYDVITNKFLINFFD